MPPPSPARSPARRTPAASSSSGCCRGTCSPRSIRGREWRAGRSSSWTSKPLGHEGSFPLCHSGLGASGHPGMTAGSLEHLFHRPVSPSYSLVARVTIERVMSMSAQRSIVIGGGAFAGLALGLALRQGLGADIPVIVADPALAVRPSRDPRATAIVAACRRLFEAIGVWGEVAAEAQPILDMVITDSKLEDATRPVFLTFAGHVEPGEPFAHMVENRHLIDVLVARAEAEGIELRATAVASFDSRSQGIDVTLADGSVIAASLLVAADGARSKLRERAGIATHGWDYDQSGIVVTVGHERDHHGRAEEHFLPAGPFAILPLTGKRSSLVWTETRTEAARIVGLSEDEFHGELEQRFGLHLGEIKALDMPRGSAWILDRPTCSTAISAGGGSTPWRWGSPPMR